MPRVMRAGSSARRKFILIITRARCRVRHLVAVISAFIAIKTLMSLSPVCRYQLWADQA